VSLTESFTTDVYFLRVIKRVNLDAIRLHGVVLKHKGSMNLQLSFWFSKTKKRIFLITSHRKVISEHILHPKVMFAYFQPVKICRLFSGLYSINLASFGSNVLV